MNVQPTGTVLSERDETVTRPIPDARVSAHDSRSESTDHFKPDFKKGKK